MKNIKLAYIINFLYYTWFWLGIWAIYYSSFGGYYAIGLLETVMIVTTILAEIPTGALGDLLGKRKTLFLGFLISALSNIWMGLAPNLLHMALSLFFMNVGRAFISGTFNALLYDSLKEEKKVNQYQKVLSNMTTITMLAFGICSIFGGYIYGFDVRLPFILNGVGTFFAALLSLYFKEPSVDSEQLTIRSYIDQNVKGVKHLFRNVKVRQVIIPMLFISSFVYVIRQGLDDIVLLDFGFKDKPALLGVMTAVMMLAAAVASHYYPKLVKNYKDFSGYITLILVSALTLIASPFVFLFAGAFTVLIRSMVSPLIDNYTSYRVNQVIDSKYRATALSTYSLVQGIPYALVIFCVTSVTDIIPSQYVALSFGIIFLLFILFNRGKK